MTQSLVVRSVEEFIDHVRSESAGWRAVWFRGEPLVETALLPRLYRPKPDGMLHDENSLLQYFRMKAPILWSGPTPDREATDQWLFLAQHVGLPTRLLDWTESALVGLYFALIETKPVVWLLNAVELNQLSVTSDMKSLGAEFPLTWIYPEDAINIGSINVRGAWEKDGPGIALPVAIQPTNIHPRMSVQRSCFTIHGKEKKSVLALAKDLVRRLEIQPDARDTMRRDLRMLGISQSTVFPDLDGLAKELAELY